MSRREGPTTALGLAAIVAAAALFIAARLLWQQWADYRDASAEAFEASPSPGLGDGRPK
ncbi:MAG TPA: hypothetical protein VLC93_17630 [Myxococcota bacterium]|nr:hypothetical protein [Myxococcota bacterium]